MSDKPLVQQRLATDLAQLILVIQSNEAASSSETSSTETALHFIAGFWEAMVREWAGIDRLR
jgi:ribosomal RNA-processing protein 1